MNELPVLLLCFALITHGAAPSESPAWLVTFGDLQDRSHMEDRRSRL